MYTKHYLNRLKLLVFLSFSSIFIGSIWAQNSDFEIGGVLYDYDKIKLNSIPDNTFTITDVNGKDVAYTNCPNPTSHPDLSFNLCLLNFNQNKLPVVLKLNEDNKYIGRTVKDIVLMQSHLLGTTQLSTYPAYSSADIQCREIVSTSDISFLRKQLLGYNKVEKCIDLYFVPRKDSIKFPRRHKIIKDTIITNLPFYGVEDLIPMHKGDVNQSLYSSNPDAELVLDASLHDSVNMYIPDINIEQGKEYDLWISTLEVDVKGVQLGFLYNNKFISIDEINSTIYYFNKAYTNILKNEFRMVLANSNEAVKINGNWFNFKFTALKDARLKDIFGGELHELPHRVVLGDLSVRPIKFTFDPSINTENIINSSIKINVTPNPSFEDININISVPSSINEGQFIIYNSLGSQIYSIELNNVQQSQELIISKDVFQYPGLYFGSLETKDGKQVVEIIRL